MGEKEGGKMNFEKKTALISGAASGMGLLFSQCFARLGGCVLMCDLNEEALMDSVKAINEEAKREAAAGVVCDVREYSRVAFACEEAVRRFGSVDVCISFAGGAETRICKVDTGALEFPDIPIEVYDWSLDVNLRAQLYFAHAALKPMREQKSGVIVTVGSITGAEGCHYNVGYATSKSGAMNGLTKSLAQFGAKYGIRCVGVAPGPVLTREAMANMKTPLGRAAEPQEVVDLILYLVSDKGAFITGETILIDGGRNAAGRKC